jgi:DNA-binding MarR family transcriptional regulator
VRYSTKQRQAIAHLQEHPHLTPAELGELLGTSPEGAAATASSLVRRGVAVRVRFANRVAYAMNRGG